MNDLLIEELNEERLALQIDTTTFAKIVAMAEVYKKEHPNITEEETAMIIRETMNCYDYSIDLEGLLDERVRGVHEGRKNIPQSFKKALSVLGYEDNERKM